MIFWSIVIVVTAIACAALFYAGAGRMVNAQAGDMPGSNEHFRLLLAGIDADEQAGKLDAAQATAARGELARELMRSQAEPVVRSDRDLSRGTLATGVAAVALLSLGLYAILGQPDLPAQPLAERPEIAAQAMDLGEAVARIEARLAEFPDELRGWQVIAPAYLELGRYGDAANAYRRVIELSGPTAQLRTDLAEALLLQADGAGSDEAMEQLRAAVSEDGTHVFSRLYLAAELMRAGQYDEATTYWQQAIGLANGDEAWLPAARQGLLVAQNDGVDTTEEQQAEMIAGMVSGLAERLYANGGSVEEWAQLVQAYVVLGQKENAQQAYDAAVSAYPAAFDRGELDTLALGAGLTLDGDSK